MIFTAFGYFLPLPTRLKPAQAAPRLHCGTEWLIVVPKAHWVYCNNSKCNCEHFHPDTKNGPLFGQKRVARGLGGYKPPRKCMLHSCRVAALGKCNGLCEAARNNIPMQWDASHFGHGCISSFIFASLALLSCIFGQHVPWAMVTFRLCGTTPVLTWLPHTPKALQYWA